MHSSTLCGVIGWCQMRGSCLPSFNACVMRYVISWARSGAAWASRGCQRDRAACIVPIVGCANGRRVLVGARMVGRGVYAALLVMLMCNDSINGCTDSP